MVASPPFMHLQQPLLLLLESAQLHPSAQMHRCLNVSKVRTRVVRAWVAWDLKAAAAVAVW